VDRLFLDANVLFSAAYREGSPLRRLWHRPGAELVTSGYAVLEAERNLQGEPRARLGELLKGVRIVGESPDRPLPGRVVLRAKDVPILAAAVAARATHLITGDRRDFGAYFGEKLAGVLVVPPRVYLTEQASKAYVWLKRRFPATVGSEFCEEHSKIRRMVAYLAGLSGGEQDPIRHEDVRALSMEPQSLDAIACFEVLEHVFEYRAALAEFSRVLRPGGVLVVTVPFVATETASILRATIDPGGAVRHLLEPEYHGDPISGEGVLCFHHFGWDLLDAVRGAGFQDAGMVDCWAPHLGFMGFPGLLVARR